MLSITEASSTRATALLGPLGPGLGHVLGNALRRVLLSSMVGYAPTEVTIAGVLHEYSTIDGVHEDVVHVMLNLKGVVFKLHNRDEVTLVLRKEGEGSVRASDIQTPHDVEVINPDHVIANLSKGGRLDMQIKVEKGRGNVQGDALRRGSSPMIGRMVLDASFSPVRRVSYAVENARVGQCTDLDKLVMEIETNGAISPEEAIRASATILVEQLLVFASLASAPASPPVAPPPSTAVDASEGLDRPLDSLDLSVRARNSLAAENITTLKQLIQHTETDLLKTPNLGRKSLNEIATVLQALGLSLAQPQ